jgi:aldehyde dehydrogenase (NAD+)
MQNLLEIFNLQSSNRWNFSETTSKQRIDKLIKLKVEIIKRREAIKLALNRDFGKPYSESELTEIHPVLDELNFNIKNLKKWMKPKKVSTPLALIGTRSQIQYEAKGVVLILAPWNYPFSLLINPLISALAAGNCVIARPSEKTPHTGIILKEIIEAVFAREEVAIVLGGIDVAEKLLELSFDHIFFTGSIQVGKKVMQAAAKNLASVTLELGGKSPVVIDRNVDMKAIVKKIVWGKFINAGQTCVAPDYIFVPAELKSNFLKYAEEHINASYGTSAYDKKSGPDYARIVDEQSCLRLMNKIKNETNIMSNEICGPNNYLAPLVFETELSSPIMEDEIFGPFLPVIAYDKIEEVLKYIRSNPKPLALYIFSNKSNFIDFILKKTTSGGVAINQVLLQLANPNLPFGGVGHSGQGSYHGHFGFRAFSHERSILIQGKFSLIGLFSPPYETWISRLAFKILRLLE